MSKVDQYRKVQESQKMDPTLDIPRGISIIRCFRITLPLERMRNSIVGSAVLDLTLSFLMFSMMYSMCDTDQSWLTLYQILHLYTWLLAFANAFTYDLGFTTATLNVYLICMILDLSGFIWHVIELTVLGKNAPHFVIFATQTAIVGLLLFVDFAAITVLVVMRRQLMPHILLPDQEALERTFSFGFRVNSPICTSVKART